MGRVCAYLCDNWHISANVLQVQFALVCTDLLAGCIHNSHHRCLLDVNIYCGNGKDCFRLGIGHACGRVHLQVDLVSKQVCCSCSHNDLGQNMCHTCSREHVH